MLSHPLSCANRTKNACGIDKQGVSHTIESRAKTDFNIILKCPIQKLNLKDKERRVNHVNR